MHSSCILDPAASLIIRHIFFAGHVQKSVMASHLKRLVLMSSSRREFHMHRGGR